MGKYNLQGADAERLYLEGNTLKTISNITGVSVTTLSSWKNRYNWEEKKSDYVRRPGTLANKIAGILNSYLDQIEIDTEGIAGGADAISKFASALNRLGSIEDLPGMAVTVMHKFLKFINMKKRNDEGFKEMLVENIQAFFKYIKQKEYGERKI